MKTNRFRKISFTNSIS